MAQDVLSRIENVMEPETQTFFGHVLSMMLRSLEDTNPNGLPVIDNVTGMDDMVVLAEVCEAYLTAQAQAKGKPTGNIDPLRKLLTIKSDLAVSVLPASSILPNNTHSSEDAEKSSRAKQK